jgi:phosphoribosylformylglycinamidine synthase
MHDLNIGIVVFPGSNCDDDLVHVLEDVCHTRVQKIWHKTYTLPDVDAVFLPGGFSYGDYLRSGAIARYAHIMPAIEAFAAKGGFVWGICNGFQILCEAGLLPGALLQNRDQKFICDNVYLRTITNRSIITADMAAGAVSKIPIASGDGRYYADGQTLQELIDHDQIIFKYCNERGETTDEANVNGSLMHIAGICNKGRNVFGMMPHPERASEDILGNQDGLIMIQSMIHHLTAVSIPS